MHVNTFSFHCLHVNPKTNWTFVTVELTDGSVGWGECSLNGWEPLQAAFAESLRELVIGKPFSSVRDIAAICETYLHSPGGLVAHSLRSATEQAMIDAFAHSKGLPVAALLAQSLDVPLQRDSVTVYANINRGTSPRTPEGFAASASRATALGFRSVKLAPFDGVLPKNCDAPETMDLIETGIARIFAVREAVGPGIGVKVDCHWRFTPRVARSVLERLRDAQLDWFECPVSEHPEFHDEIRSLRRQANAINVKLAGAEMFTNVQGFRSFIEGRLYDTIMPDIKYCGGFVALFDIAEFASKHGIQTSPHNPTGPICNFASLHACAVAPGCDLLEYQLGESTLYRAIVGDFHPTFHDGRFTVPASIGLGAAVDLSLVAQHPFKPVVDGFHPSLG